MLGQIPTESSARAILDWIAEGDEVDEMQVYTLSSIGSPSAIEPLYALWEPDDALLAEHLLILCELNGVEKPELAEWRRLVAVQEGHFES